MMKRVRFYIGMKTKDYEPVTYEIRKKLELALAAFGGGGYTKTFAFGSWDGRKEPARVYEFIMDVSHETAQETAAHLAHIAKQNCVLVTLEPVDAYFVRAAYSEDTPEVQV